HQSSSSHHRRRRNVDHRRSDRDERQDQDRRLTGSDRSLHRFASADSRQVATGAYGTSHVKHAQVAALAKDPGEPRSLQRVNMIDWVDIRNQFPVTQNSVYLNTAAAGPLSVATAQAGEFY